MIFLHTTPEEQLVDLSLEYPTMVMYSPLARIFLDLGVSFPNCWIGVRMKTDLLKESLPSGFDFDKHKIPGDLDIIGGSLVNGMLSDDIIGIEIKRFRYMYSADKQSWIVKNPDSYGRKQARGYSFLGFDKIMLCHFVVAEPDNNPDYNLHLLNASIIGDGIRALRKKRIKINPDDPFGYCIVGWSQVPHRDPLYAGSLPGPDTVKTAPKNPLRANVKFQSIRRVLLRQIQERIDEHVHRSLPMIIDFS